MKRVFQAIMMVCCLVLTGALVAPGAKIAGLNGSSPLMALLGLVALSMALAAQVYGRRRQWRPLSNKSPRFLLGASLSLCLAPLSLMAQGSVRAPVNLRTAGNYVVLSKTGITDVPPSPIVGNIGASPITGAAIHVTCSEVTGTIYAVDAAGPAPCAVTDSTGLGTAIGDMATAFTDAAGRTIPDFTNLGAGNISGRTLVPGLYKWSTDVIADDTGFTLSGGPNAVWIFQISGNLTIANGAHITLAGGAQPTNIFWQVGGGVGLTLGTGAVFYGNVLSASAVVMNTGSSLIGRALAVTDVTLAMSPVTSPGTLVFGLPVIVAPTVTSTAPVNLAPTVPVNSALTATFSEAMNPATITTSTFTLKNGLTSITGTVSYVGVTATFIPSANLPANTTLTANITTGAQDPAGVALANYVWTFTTAAAPDLTPPTVSSTVPANGATAVPVGNALSATFSKPINPLTINNATFTLRQGGAAVAGVVTYAGVTATFTPTSNLAANLPFTATLTTGVQDLSGNPLAANYVWSFTTGAAPNLIPPTVSSTVPASNATNVPIGNALSATFSEPINPLTINTTTFTVKQGSTAVAGTVTYAGVTATFTPTGTFAPNLPFTATITTGVQDLSGNPMAANYVWSFTTGATPNLTPPTVSSTVPASNATNVPIGNALSATFSEALNPLTVTTATFTLSQGATPVPGTVTYAGVTATFTPLSPLAASLPFTATITTGVTDLAGNHLVTNYAWSFTSGSAPNLTPPTVSFTVPASNATNVPIGNALSATFSEAINPLTITTATFTLRQGASPVAGTVTYAGVTATFTPTGTLAPNLPFTATITTGVQDLSGNALAANYVWTFTTGATPDTTPPTVSFTVPFSGATNVPIGNALSATFSKAINPLTITTATFTLRQGATSIPGTVTYAGVTATFTPTGTLAPNLPFTATITTGVQDLSGNALAANYVWSFTTGATPDTTPPTVSYTVPYSNATNVPIGNALSVTFSKAINPLTINTATFTLRQGTTSVSGTVTYAGVTATFTPGISLAPNASFTATITTGVQDLSGNALAANYVWSFTTGATPDTTPPTVISTSPANGATSVAISEGLAAMFSKPMNPLTINTVTFKLTQGGVAVAGTVSYSGVTAIFLPVSSLAPSALFTATITTGATDLAGNALVSNYVWTFTTGTLPDTTAPTVISTTPASGATLVTTTANVVANFSEVMNPLTITTATFTLQQGTTPVTGTVTYAGTSATFSPSSRLTPNTVYNAVITSVAADPAGNTLAANYLWSFTTGTASGQTPVCLSSFAILAGGGVVGNGTSTVTGDIGTGPGNTVTGFPPGTLVGTIHIGDQAAAQGINAFTAAYADAVSRSTGAVAVAGDIGLQTFTAGLYRSAGSLAITSGNLILDAKGDPNAVFIFQMATTFTTAAGQQIVLANGAQAFNVFLQVGTSATLGASSVINGSILAEQSITMGTGSVVNGRLEALTGTVTLQSSFVTSFPPGIFPGGTVNGADDVRTVAAGSIASVFGNNLAGSLTSSVSYPLPLTLGGSSLQVGTQSAPLFMTSCGQANIQIPWEAAGLSQVAISATVGGLVTTAEPVALAPFAPGIFSLNALGAGQGAVEIAPTATIAGQAVPGSNPVPRGGYIAIFCTGLGPVTNQPATGAAALSNPLSQTLALPTVTIGGAPAQVTFSGLAPGYAGLYQVNAIVPAGAPANSNVTVFLTIGGVNSNTVTIAIQ